MYCSLVNQYSYCSHVIFLIFDKSGCVPLYAWACRCDQRISVILVWKSSVSSAISLESQGDLDASSQTESRLYTDVLISLLSSPSPASHLSSGLLCSPIPLSLVSYIVNGCWMAHYSVLQTLSAAINSVWALSHTSVPPTQQLVLFAALARLRVRNKSPFQSVFVCVFVCTEVQTPIVTPEFSLVVKLDKLYSQLCSKSDRDFQSWLSNPKPFR